MHAQTHMLYDYMLSALVASLMRIGAGADLEHEALWVRFSLCWFSLWLVLVEGVVIGRLG